VRYAAEVYPSGRKPGKSASCGKPSAALVECRRMLSSRSDAANLSTAIQKSSFPAVDLVAKARMEGTVRKLVSFFLIAISSLGASHAAGEGSLSRESASPPKADAKAYFGSSEAMDCDKRHVVLNTNCANEGQMALSYCYVQTISFINLKAKYSTTVTYTHPWRKEGQDWIDNISCFSSDGVSYILARNYSMLTDAIPANCGECEWIDVFMLDGKYLGTLAGDANYARDRDGPQLRKPLEPALRAKLPASDPEPGIENHTTIWASRTSKSNVGVK